ncbi:MAG: cupin domain-containing protein [Minwuia sp.]|uniref:cupin domain-containing protein n=1 Tax=Minwuia sp. TaxID=2493630 RepID=UPI003A85EEE1
MTEMFSSETAGLPRPDAGTLVARTAGQDWQSSGSDGFLVKPLHEDPATGRRTWLMKVEPGAYAPAHAHEEFEELYILEGSFDDGEHTYHAGDYAIRAPGAMHESKSEAGALVLVIYSR